MTRPQVDHSSLAGLGFTSVGDEGLRQGGYVEGVPNLLIDNPLNPADTRAEFYHVPIHPPGEAGCPWIGSLDSLSRPSLTVPMVGGGVRVF